MKMKTKSKMKRRLFFGFALIICLLVGGLFIYRDLEPDGKLGINISALPKNVMEDYFESFSNMVKLNNKENILIVTSKVPLEETYGAINVVAAPNFQYFLQYKNEEDRKHALNMFKTMNIKASENKTYKFTDDGPGETTYNSWGIKAMGLDKATELVETIDNLPEITVAIVDTGLDMDLMDRYFPGKVNEVYNILDPDDEMVDEYGHGTHIAGTIAEGTPDNVKILPVKVSSSESISDVDIITAINYITYYEKADVINMSFGGEANEFTEETYVAIEAAKEKGIISVTAAGNESTSEANYPSGFDNTISVSAIDSYLSLADYSNYGEMITFTAPGTDIKSIMSSDATISIEKEEPDFDDDFETISGTSMATPHVVSAVAVLKSISPSLGFEAVVDILKDHVVDLGPKGWDKLYGYGLINFDSVKFCRATSSDCDAYSIFEKFVPNGIEIDEVVLTRYNYGSLTNILATTISISSTNGDTIEKKIGDLDIDDYQILGYNPYSSEEQTVTLRYSGLEISFNVKNPNNYKSGWEYSTPRSGSSGLALTGYKNHNLGIKTLYFPNTTSDGTPVVSLEDPEDENCVFGVYNSEKGKCVELVDALDYTTIVLPENLRQIRGTWTLGNSDSYSKPGALENLERIVSYTDELTLFGTNTLAGMKKLYSIEANINLDMTAEKAFSDDTMLANVTLSDNNTIIPDYTFRNCYSLSEITIPESVGVIREYAFLNAGIKELHIPKNVRSIGEGMLEGASQLEKITVSEENVWYYSPDGSNAIIQVGVDKLVAGASSTVIPEGVKIIGRGALLDIDVYEIIVPEGVTTIEENSIFSVDIGKIVLPRSLKNISDYAFDGIHSRCSSYKAGFCSFEAFAFWVHSDSYALDWVIREDYGYVIIEELDESSESMYISWVEVQTYAVALDTINDENTDVYVYLTSKEGNSDSEPVRATIVGVKYILDNGEESSTGYLTAGYNGFIIIYEIGVYRNMRTGVVWADISKRTPEYTIPTGLEADPGQRLSEITLPDGFSWDNPDDVINGAGRKKYPAVFIPEDTDNYLIVNVFITIFVRTDKELIEPTIVLNNDMLVRDDPIPITREEVTVSGFEPIDGDGDGYTIMNFRYYYDKETEKGHIRIVLHMSDRQFESHYFEGGYQDWGGDIELDTIYSSNPFIGAHDGKEHSISFNLGERYSQCTITYSKSDNGQYDLTKLPMFREAGIYNVYYRVDCGGSHSFTGSNTVTITGFIIDESIIKDGKLRIVSNKPEDLLSKIQIIGDEGTDVRILNSDDEKVTIEESTVLATGYFLETQVGAETTRYEIALVGDLNGDGFVNDVDLNAMKRHLTFTELLEGIYLLAGDISNNNLINSGDLLWLKQYLLGIKAIE